MILLHGSHFRGKSTSLSPLTQSSQNHEALLINAGHEPADCKGNHLPVECDGVSSVDTIGMLQLLVVRLFCELGCLQMSLIFKLERLEGLWDRSIMCLTCAVNFNSASSIIAIYIQWQVSVFVKVCTQHLFSPRMGAIHKPVVPLHLPVAGSIQLGQRLPAYISQ